MARKCSCRFLIIALLHSCIFAIVLPASVPAFASNRFDAPDTSQTSASALEGRLSFADAVHLLQRTGIGASPIEISRILGLDRSTAVNQLIENLDVSPATALPEWVNRPAPAFWARGDMGQDDARDFDRARDREIVQLKRWWVREMIETTSPQTERLVLMWHSHFATAYSGVNRQSTSIARQNQMFRHLGSGNFKTLLKAIVRDPAILNYLDNTSNKKESPNENLARELLELFTMGEGNFDEQLVREAARALTGYNIAEGRNMSFQFEAWPHDEGKKNLFGEVGHFNGDDLIDRILEQPQVATHIARLFWRTFVSDTNTDPNQIDNLAHRFRESGYDIKTLYRATLNSNGFWRAENRGTIIKSPVDLLIGTIRSLGQSPSHWQSLHSWLARFGQDLFEPPNVAGWPGGAYWVAPDRLHNRMTGLMEALSVEQEGVVGESQAGRTRIKLSAADGMAGESMMSDKRSSDSRPKQFPISIKLAAENYQGAVEFDLVLRKAGRKVWSSGKIVVVNGHDTERFGRVEGASMPWQILQLGSLDSGVHPDTIEARFLNDKAGPSGDRNLYIDWVRVADYSFFAADGRQDSGCVPMDARSAGNFYCQGILRVDRRTEESPDKATIEQVLDRGGVVAGRVHTWWMDNPDNAWSQMVIGLTDVQLRSQQSDVTRLHTLMINLVEAEGPGFGIRLDSTGCWPDCVREWPDCAWKSEHDSRDRSLFFPARPPSDQTLQCHWEKLGQDGRQLVRSVWRVIPELLVATAAGRKAANRPARFERWEKKVSDMLADLDRSYYQVPTDIAKQPKLMILNTAQQPVSEWINQSDPEVAGESYTAYAAAVERLNSDNFIDGEFSLARVLSSIPLMSSSGQLNNLKAIIEDPAYQVR